MNKPVFKGDYLEYSRGYLEYFLSVLKTYGVTPRIIPEILSGAGMLCYYDLELKKIYVTVPDMKDPAGKLQYIYFRSLLGLESNEELTDLILLLLPRLVAHELGHFLRDHEGLFGEDLWLEEQIANQIADALTSNSYSITERKRLETLLRKSVGELSRHMQTGSEASDSYYSLLQALQVGGHLGLAAAGKIELLQELFSVNAEVLLKNTGKIPVEIAQKISLRPGLINDFNDEYTSNFVQYLYYQTGWTLLDLETREQYYVDEVLRNFFGKIPALLPSIRTETDISDGMILALYRAAKRLKETTETAYRYFYKRYRTVLLEKLALEGDTIFCREAKSIMSVWDDTDIDLLEFAMHLAPEPLKRLFPGRIEESLKDACETPRLLENETDLRIWSYCNDGSEDEGVTNTLKRFELLDKSAIFRNMPSEFIMELSKKLFLIQCLPGETIIHAGCRNNDVFILKAGCLKVYSLNGEEIGSIEEGEMLGEISFFSNDNRTATVKSLVHSECFVLKAADLHRMSMARPEILMQMAKILAKRFTNSFQTS